MDCFESFMTIRLVFYKNNVLKWSDFYISYSFLVKRLMIFMLKYEVIYF